MTISPNPNLELPLFDKKMAIETGAYDILLEVITMVMNDILRITNNIHPEKPDMSFHAIKSSATNVGFQRLADYAAQLEN